MKNRLPELRAGRGWTQADLAGRLEVSRQTAALFDCRIEDVFDPG